MILDTAVGRNFARLQIANAIVICHGFPYEPGSVVEKGYDKLAELFSRIAPTLIFDFSGCGKSRGYFSPENWVEDLKKIAQKFKSVSIIGYSMGAMVALKACAELENVEKLVLIAPPLPEIFEQKRLEELYAQATKIVKIKSFNEFLALRQFFDLERVVTKINASKLIVHGTKDEIVPFFCGEKIYKIVREPKSFLKVINGSHFLRRDEKVMQKVAEWLEGKIKEKNFEITV
ncbi:MAG: alpha/beta hydrolase [Archaeoglobaceae archaeon]